MAKTATRQVSIFLNGKEVENNIKAIAAAQKQLNNELARVEIGSEEYDKLATEVQKANGVLAEHRKTLNGVQQGVNGLKAGIDKYVGIAAGAFAADALLGYGKELYNTGIQMDALTRKAQTVFGSTLPQITAEAEKNAAAMGLTNSQYIAAAASIQDLLIPMGFQRQAAADISGQLVNLSGALSEWTGGQLKSTDVSHILTKALLGERDELKQLGISISDNDVKAQLAAKGLDKLTGSALEQAKAAATLELILNKSTDAQAAFANGAGSAVRQQAELAAKTQQIVEKLAAILLPIFQGLANIAGAVVDSIGSVTDAVGDMINPAQSASKAFDQQSQRVADLQKNISPLLDRYDQLKTKSNLTTAEQTELKKIVSQVSETIPSAVAAFDEYGKALSLNTDAARNFIEVEKARLEFVNQKAIEENQKTADELQKNIADEQKVIDSLKKNLEEFANATTENKQTINKGIQDRSAQIDKYTRALQGANAEIERLKGANLKVPDLPANTNTGGNTGEIDKQEAERRQKELTDLIKRVAEIRLDLISKAQDDELQITIRGIEKKYQTELDKATELEKKGVTAATAQRIALEKLKQEEIGNAVKAYTEKSVQESEDQARKEGEARRKAEQEEFDKDNKQRAEFADARQKAEDDIKSFKQENLLTDLQQEIQTLTDHYQYLLDQATKFGIDTTEITAAYEAAKTKITKDETDKRLKYEEDLTKAQSDLELAKVSAVQEGANAIAGLLDQSSAVAKGLFLVEKAAAAVSVILNLQKEKAAIYAAARLGTLFDPTGAVALALATPQIIAANIRAGISLGSIAATAIKPFVKQKSEGSYLDVTGASDRRSYRAKVIGPPDTGLLPHFPVLFTSNATGAPVLASERGSEYFVAAHHLRNPYVANLVRMIDLATHGGTSVQQFADGGSTTTAPAPSALVGIDSSMILKFVATIDTLNSLLSKGIIAVIPDGTVIDIDRRFRQINEASGGYYQ